MSKIKPLVNFSELLDLKALPEAETKKPKIRGDKFKISRQNGTIQVEKITEKVPKTLVCHDMKGGYLEDRFGSKDLECEPYVFTQWSKIDIFVYFSHNFVTIPPLSWIEAAHKNGVKILGTIITEFKDGEKIWDDIFASKENQEVFVKNLTKIAKVVGFDGWLFNIENKIEKDKIPDLIQIVQSLTESMHNLDPDNLVIWYDSVTINGELKWQNCLNDLNSAFFDVCDGIFLNYTWTEEGLSSSVFQAPERLTDIYVGIDVFGRGCPGGGGFNCDQAMTMIKYHSLSYAIFAQGWTHECAQVQDFRARDEKFWNLLEPLLYHQGVKMDLLELDCNPGSGMDLNGLWWINLAKQSISPSFQNETICDVKISPKTKIEAIFDQNVTTIKPEIVLDETTKAPKFNLNGNSVILELENERHCILRLLNFEHSEAKLKKIQIVN